MSYIKFRRQKREIISQPLYDTNSIATGNAVVNFQFFQVPLGQAGSGFAAAKTLLETNMRLAGQLPRPQVFFAKTMQFAFRLATAATGTYAAALNDTEEIMQGVLVLTVGSKVMLEAPLLGIPGGTGIFRQVEVAAAAAAVGYATNGIPQMQNRWFLKHRIMFDENENFRAEVQYRVAPNPAAAAQNTDISVTADGELIRSIQ